MRSQFDSWNLLLGLGRDQILPWMVCGDFNEILYSFEKKGGLGGRGLNGGISKGVNGLSVRGSGV